MLVYYATLGLIGAALAVTLGLLARYNVHFVMGLVPLFPAFAILAHVLAVRSGATGGLLSAAGFGLYALCPYAAYLLSVLLLSRHVGPYVAIIIGIGIWIVLAAGLVFAWRSGVLPGSDQ